jgi:hypothetical protein
MIDSIILRYTLEPIEIEFRKNKVHIWTSRPWNNSWKDKHILAYSTVATQWSWKWTCIAWQNWEGKPKYSEKTCPNANLFTINPTWCGLGSNSGIRSGKPATNCLGHDSAELMTNVGMSDETTRIYYIVGSSIHSSRSCSRRHSHQNTSAIKKTTSASKLSIYRVFIVQAYWTSRTSYRQTLVSPGKLKVIHSVISQCYAIECDRSFYVLRSVSLWLVWVNVQSACSLNPRYTTRLTGTLFILNMR